MLQYDAGKAVGVGTIPRRRIHMSNEIKKDQIPTEQNGMNNSSAIRDAEELSDIENEAAANVVHGGSGEKN